MSELLSGPSFLLDWQAAEVAAVDHMKTLGFIDAQLTGAGADGGIDAQSSEAAAQVKFYANPIGRPDIQRLRGAAHEYRLALFYSTGGYTKEATAYAIEADVALFLMDPHGHCEPVSGLAALLVEPEHVLERKERLEELQAIQYRFAASALESDLKLFAEFAMNFLLNNEEQSLFSHVLTSLEGLVPDFRAAIESKHFAQADIEFGEIQSRALFLSFITGPGLKPHYTGLDEAIAEGWQRDEANGSEYLLQRVATGVVELKVYLSESLDPWTAAFPNGVPELIDAETDRFAGLVLAASIDPSVVTLELLQQLKATLRAGIKRGQVAAKKAFKDIINKHADLRLQVPRRVIAGMLRADSIANRLYRQLDASKH